MNIESNSVWQSIWFLYFGRAPIKSPKFTFLLTGSHYSADFSAVCTPKSIPLSSWPYYNCASLIFCIKFWSSIAPFKTAFFICYARFLKKSIRLVYFCPSLFFLLFFYSTILTFISRPPAESNSSSIQYRITSPSTGFPGYNNAILSKFYMNSI